ncbi:MAG: hypothetical protein KAG64_02885 [Bacteroidales bacterium]|nr:hypothetical protein [Bacteroidales bacterium]
MLHIAIPLLEELDNIPTLLKSIAVQNHQDYKVYFCVNQPDDWWGRIEKIAACNNNQSSIKMIQETAEFPFEIIDKSSLGQGWKAKKLGVGWARKTLTDRILDKAKEDDIIISLDADTTFSENYFSTIEENLKKHPKAPAIAVPYYHPLSKKEAEDRAILHYEIYMRYYLINLFRINSPYAFSALGSAIAMPVWALRKIGGLSPKKSGEDFYLLQKMVKFRPILNWNDEKVFPAARFSNRVFFGTGPAMIKGNDGDWSSYPIYPMDLFNQIAEFYKLIPQLFEKNISTPIDSIFGNTNDCNIIWENLRKNNKDLPHFTKAIHDKFDGLRILQFLKQNVEQLRQNEEKILIDFILHMDKEKEQNNFKEFSFSQSPISQLNEIRDYLCSIEDDYRLNAMKQYGK